MSDEMQTTPSQAAIEEAKNNPNGWVYQVDHSHDTSQSIPSEAIAGAWRVDERGEIVGKFIPNPNYISKKSEDQAQSED